MINNSDTFTLQVFDHKGLPKMTLSQRPSYLVSTDAHNDVAKALAENKCVYVKPKQQNHKLIDS